MIVKMSDAPTRPWHVKDTSIYDANDQLVCTVGVFTSHEDSALIAAVPTMLDALQHVLAWLCYGGPIEDDGITNRMFVKANNAVHAAIIKAEGR